MLYLTCKYINILKSEEIMKINRIKGIILAFSLGLAVISNAQAQTWQEDGMTCHLNEYGKKSCYRNYYNPNSGYHGHTYYGNNKGMKTVCHYDNYGHKKCYNTCQNGNLC
jgi:hypothetical protein